MRYALLVLALFAISCGSGTPADIRTVDGFDTIADGGDEAWILVGGDRPFSEIHVEFAEILIGEGWDVFELDDAYQERALMAASPDGRLCVYYFDFHDSEPFTRNFHRTVGEDAMAKAEDYSTVILAAAGDCP
jgi:hypothetical protein